MIEGKGATGDMDAGCAVALEIRIGNPSFGGADRAIYCQIAPRGRRTGR